MATETPAILEQLTAEENHAFLTRIYLREEDIDAALASLATMEETPVPRWWLRDRGLGTVVAAAAKETHPRETIRLYLREAERLIEQRGRDNYAAAAGYLTDVRALYEQLGELESWQQTIAAIRAHKPRLPAMLDELKQAGL